MRILTLWEPWATLMAIGEKRIETRSWATSYRGPLAIHAAKGGFTQDQLSRMCLGETCLEPHFKEALGSVDLNRGHIVAVVTLADCVPVEKCASLGSPKDKWLTPKEESFGDYSHGRYGWITGDLFRLPRPIPYKGSQGLGILPLDVVEQIKAQGWNGPC